MDRRAFLSLAAVGLGAGALAACGGGSDGSSAAPDTSAPSPGLLAGRSFAVRRDPG